MRLLIVDDSSTNLKLLRAQLEAEGHGVLEAANGVEALKILDRESVDGVVSDILMPGMDGFRLCLEIRKKKAFSRLPFVFYTSTYKSPQDQELARTVGGDRYITKPSPVRVILSAVEEAMQKTRDRIAVSAARHDEGYVLKQYNEALVRKLEERNQEIDDALKRLQATHMQLLASEARFRALVENGFDAVSMIAADGTVIYRSPAASRILGYAMDELLKQSSFDLVHPGDLEAAKQMFQSLLRKPSENAHGVTRYRHKDGSWRWLEGTGTNLLDQPEVRAIVINFRDVTERVLQEHRIERLSRIRDVTSEINAAIVRVRDRQMLFQEICRIAVERAHLGSAWVGVLDAATLDITPVAWAGEGSDEMYKAKSTARDDPARGQGAVSRAVRERRVVVNNDLSREAFGGPRLQAVLKLGLRSMIALPLFEGDAVAGTLTLYAKEPDFFDDEEIALLTELAGNISFALEHMARQEKIGKLSRIRAVSSEVNSAIVRIRERETLLQETCRIASEHGKFELVWVGEIDSERQSVRPAASMGFSLEAAHAVNWSSISSARGTLGEAILGRKPAVRNDIRSELPAGKLREEALKQGCYSTVCLPLTVDDSVVALIVLFATGTGFFDEDELALLTEMTADVSFALQSIAQQEKVEYLSYYDAVTGLPNRRLFMDRAGQQLRSRDGEPLMVALILVNLERFRNINESFGRQGGDTLLSLVAHRLETAIHGKDYLARIGADNFGIVIPDVRDGPAVVHAVDSQILGCFKDPFSINGKELRVAARAGVALYPEDGGDADTLFRNAEAALKRARASGDSYLFYAAEMNAKAAQALSMETRLRNAVEAQQFVLHYQPKIELASGRMSGLEALIRWQDPESGLVAPGAFIPLLEETGLIRAVGRWALAQALAQHREWTSGGHAVPRVAVNVSAIQLQQRDFSDIVISVMQEGGASPDALELEITESLLMRNVQESIRKLTILRGLGIHISMDDFGTGYSSLSYIARLPINSLKIDRSFINGMAGNPQDMSIVSTIIGLARSLNLRVVAEGVETEDQAKLLRLLKCDEAQGYLFSKPLPATEIESQLRAKAQPAR
jgi:PAS domain S-box-containing protein/diguanylate cyclase (GGDEF)-like protein